MKKHIDYKLVRSRFHYDPETGVLTRKESGAIAGSVDGSGPNSDRPYKRASIYCNKKNFIAYVHRIIWVWMTGQQPDNIDHIDGNGLNNKWSNLRSVPHKVNCKNQKIHTTNTSGISGVTKRDNGKWRARIMVDGNMIDLGTFAEKESAVKARKQGEQKYFF